MTVEQEVDNSNAEQSSSPEHAPSEPKRRSKKFRNKPNKRVDYAVLENENRQLMYVNEYLCKQLEKLETTPKKSTKVVKSENDTKNFNAKVRIPAKNRDSLNENEEREMLGGVPIIRNKYKKQYKPLMVLPESQRKYGGILMLKNCYRGDVLHSDSMIRDDLKAKVRMHRLHPRKRIMQSITNTRSINWKYSCIVLMTCVHDLYDDDTGSGSEYMEDISAMCDDICEMYGKEMKIVIGGVSNVGHEGNSSRRIKEYNSAVEGYCKSHDNCEFVDISNINVDPFKSFESDESSMQELRTALIDVLAPISSQYIDQMIN